ncbi:GEVED domain-containing protein, partial [Algoriphagus sp. A40]|uniref:DUF7507 domain-containing protein n=1 Tax=Algoriphagus sp. A40 TaxID=1945863 RepID=UPI0009CE85CD
MDRLSNCDFTRNLERDSFIIWGKSRNQLGKNLFKWLVILAWVSLSNIVFAQTRPKAITQEVDIIPFVDYQNLGNSGIGARTLASPMNARVLEDFPNFCEGIYNLNFQNGIKIAGPGNPGDSNTTNRFQVGDIYTFQNVVTLPGNIVVHARVTIETETLGQISLFDNTAEGYPSALQPSFLSNSNTSTGQGFGVFNFEFGTGTYNTTTGAITGFTPIQIPAFNAYLVDVDGETALNEFQAVTGGGQATFGQGAAANIQTVTDPAPFLNRYQDRTQSSANGIPINIFDRMVRIEFTNVSTFKWKFGVNYRSSGGSTRLFSFYVLCIPEFVPAAGDYSDAPATYGSPNHLISGTTNITSTPRFGPIVDREPIAVPNVDASGDDLTSVDLQNPTTIDDEDGLFNGDGTVLSGDFNAGGTKALQINTRGTGVVSGWIDWNRDGDFLDAGEQFIVNQSVSGTSTNNQVTVPVPCDASTGVSYLRIRISTVTNLTPLGTADNGEVEDYKITIADPNNLSPVVIGTQPVGATYCQNTPAANVANLSVAATGSGTLTYQWFTNGTSNSNTGGTAIPNATSSSYKPATATVGTTYYYVIVTGNCKPATSNPVAVVVQALPAVPVITPIPPTCTVATGGFSFNRVAGVEYSLAADFSSIIPGPGNSVTGLPAGSSGILYARTVGTTCVASSPYTIGAQPVTPVPPVVTPIDPTCSVPTGGFSFDRVAGVEYSLAANFSSIIPGPGNSVTGLPAGSSGTLYARTIGTICVVSTPYTIAAQPTCSLTIDKSLTNNDDAVVDMAGETIEYTIVISNTGTFALTGVAMTDPFAGGATYVSGDTGSDNILGVGEVWTYSADYVVTQADLNAGTDLVNVATVVTNQTTPKSDDATSTISKQPNLTITKSLVNVEDLTVDLAGETIEYIIVVTNAGNVDLTNVLLTDPFAGGATFVSGDTGSDLVLGVGEIWTYSADYVVTQADLNAGLDLVNVATVDSDQTDPKSDQSTSNITQGPNLLIEKTLTNAEDGVVDTAGETIEYTIAFINSGNIALTGVVVTDPFAGGATYVSGDTGSDNVLGVGEIWTYSADYVVTQADLNSGLDLVNVATVVTNQTTPKSSSVSSDVAQNATLIIEKTLTNAEDALVDLAGETIEYTITVDNTGNVDLTNVVLSDDFAGGATLIAGDDGDNILETNEVWTYSADYLVTLADLNAGAPLVNTATVDTDQTQPISDDATSTIGQTRTLSLDKQVVSGDPYAAVGDVVVYNYVITNSGNVTLAGPF